MNLALLLFACFGGDRGAPPAQDHGSVDSGTCDPWSPPANCLEAALSGGATTCTDADANRVFDPPAGVDGMDFGVTGNFLGDLDGDGADDITLAVPGQILHGEEDPYEWTFSGAITHNVYLSGASCSNAAHVSAGNASATVKTSEGVSAVSSRDLASVALLVGIGDLDADGTPDVAQLDYDTASGGWAAVFSGRELVEGAQLTEADRIGAVLPSGGLPALTQIGVPGDVDGDGVTDLLVGSLWDAQVRVYSGASVAGTGVEADRFIGELPYGLPMSGNGGDVDGDGLGDIALVVQAEEKYTYEVDIWFASDVANVGVADAPPSATIGHSAADRPWLDLDADADGRNDVLLARWPQVDQEGDPGELGEVAVVLSSQLASGGVLEDPHFRIQSDSADGLGVAAPRPVGMGGVLYEAGSDLGFRIADHVDIATGGSYSPAPEAVLPHDARTQVWFPASGDADGDGQRDILGDIGYDPAVFLFP